jgi:hypothetical protein
MGSRVLKVRRVIYTNTRGHFVKVPSIRIQGKWLEQLGFTIGCFLEVIENTNEITLKVELRP